MRCCAMLNYKCFCCCCTNGLSLLRYWNWETSKTILLNYSQFSLKVNLSLVSACRGSHFSSAEEGDVTASADAAAGDAETDTASEDTTDFASTTTSSIARRWSQGVLVPTDRGTHFLLTPPKTPQRKQTVLRNPEVCDRLHQ
jgi:hypothetical protein